MLQQLEPLTQPIAARLGLQAGSVSAVHVAALWELCSYEAALDLPPFACPLFDAQVRTSAAVLRLGSTSHPGGRFAEVRQSSCSHQCSGSTQLSLELVPNSSV